MASVDRVLMSLVAVLVCVMALSQAYSIPGRADVNEMAVGDQATNNEMAMPDLMTAEEEAEVDGMFHDRMADDLKLELILKALVILKSYEGHSSSLSSWFPSYDVMSDELKLKLILKAIILLKDRPIDSWFARHVVGELQLTLILKAIFILEESKSDFGLAFDNDVLKLALILKAIDILEVYKGDFEDTVFFTKSKKQLKLALILKAIALLKQGKWPIDIDDLWRKEGDDGEEEGSDGNQPEATTPEQTTEEPTAAQTTSPPATTAANREDGEAGKKPWVKKGISKVFRLIKWLPKVIHKKKHVIFH